MANRKPRPAANPDGDPPVAVPETSAPSDEDPGNRPVVLCRVDSVGALTVATIRDSDQRPADRPGASFEHERFLRAANCLVEFEAMVRECTDSPTAFPIDRAARVVAALLSLFWIREELTGILKTRRGRGFCALMMGISETVPPVPFWSLGSSPSPRRCPGWHATAAALVDDRSRWVERLAQGPQAQRLVDAVTADGDCHLQAVATAAAGELIEGRFQTLEPADFGDLVQLAQGLRDDFLRAVPEAGELAQAETHRAARSQRGGESRGRQLARERDENYERIRELFLQFYAVELNRFKFLSKNEAMKQLARRWSQPGEPGFSLSTIRRALRGMSGEELRREARRMT